jgi:electron transfer flavoprotein beta subunit
VVVSKGVPPVLNPFDENALEAALRIKDTEGAEVMVVSMGRALAKPVLMKSLAAGADELILLQDDSFEDLDSYSTAYILAAAIKKIGKYDLVLCGRQAADTDAGQVGSGVAEILGIPSITGARKVEVNKGMVKVEREIFDGYEVVQAPLPALVTASNEIGELRSVTVKAMITAQKKPVTTWSTRDLGIVTPLLKRIRLLNLFARPLSEAKCEIVQGESLEEAGANLALKLREAGLL